MSKSQINTPPQDPAGSTQTKCAVSRRSIPLTQAIILKEVKASPGGKGQICKDTGEQLSINRLLVKVHVSSSAETLKEKYGESEVNKARIKLGLFDGSTNAETVVRVNGTFSKFRECFVPGGEIKQGCELLVAHIIDPSLV